MAAPARSCGTCRERRILCDRATPTCQQCVRSKRTCQGYGLRLSWPKPRDTKRAVVGESSIQTGPRRPVTHLSLIHTSPWDIEMHYHMTLPSPDASARPTLRIPTQWNPSTLEAGDKELIEYFKNHASQSLATFGDNPAKLGQTLLRVTLAGNSNSAASVLLALLSFSSLHRYGAQTQAFELKMSSLRALAAASKPENTLVATEIIQHIVAGMLLCSFEVYQSSCTSNQWTWYIAGVKHLLTSSSLPQRGVDSDFDVIMDWVHHHDVLARFTLRHWEGTTIRPSSTSSTVWTETQPETHGVSPLREDATWNGEPQPPSALLDLLSRICDVVSERPKPQELKEELDDFRNRLQVLDWKIRTVAISPKPGDSLDAQVIEVYKLAMLVYVNRVSSNLLDQAVTTQQQIDKGFLLLSQLSSCERQFPVFILGCEARTDEQRSVIIELIARTEIRDSSRKFVHIKMLLDIMWNQNDLATCSLDYWEKMTSIISCCTVVPSLV